MKHDATCCTAEELGLKPKHSAASMEAVIGHECVAASEEHPSNTEREVMSVTQPV